jgi:hypothetical protein
MSDENVLLKALFTEYERLKQEQAQRIGFRDNLLYVTLGLFGVLVSAAAAKDSNYYTLLVIPWVSLILGWTYLVNDQKISAIGQYVRQELEKKIQQNVLPLNTELDSGATASEKVMFFGWESIHRQDQHRTRRKLQQLIIDELTFPLSGIGAVIAFLILVPTRSCGIVVFCIVEVLLLTILSIEIIIYSNFDSNEVQCTFQLEEDI